MFEEAHLLGSTERSIIVQTRRGRDVPNVIELEPGERERRKYERLLDRYGKHWQRRKGAAGVYNCAGHVWASRRTTILEDAAWKVILEDDAYRKLRPGDEPAAGDLVIYSDNQVGFLHVGLVLEVRQGLAPGAARLPWVLSKWDSTSGEVMHHVHDVPFNQAPFSVSWDYWTDRPTAN